MSVERDLLGLELDSVLEGYYVDFTVDTCAVHLDRDALATIDDDADRYRHRIVLRDDPTPYAEPVNYRDLIISGDE